MKNIWIINQCINIPGDCGNLRHYSLVKYIKKENWNFTLITCDIENLRNIKRKVKGKNKIPNLKNVEILWLRIFKWPKQIYFLRGLGMIEFMLKIIFFLPFYNIQKPDLIIGSSPNLLAAFGAAIISIYYRVPFVLEIRDLWPETLIQLKAFKKNSIFNLLFKIIEKFLIRFSKKIIVVMENGSLYYKNLGLEESKFCYIPNGIDMKERTYKKICRQSGNNPFNLLYIGSIGYPNALDVIIKSMYQLKMKGYYKDKIILNIYGDGPLKKEMINLSINLNLDNVFFNNASLNNDISKLYECADGLIFAMLDLPEIYNYGVSFNKIFEYLSSSRPVIYNSNSKFNPMNYSGAGIKTASLNETDFAKSILYLLNLSLDDTERLTRNGFNYVSENHSYEYLAKRLEKILCNLI